MDYMRGLVYWMIVCGAIQGCDVIEFVVCPNSSPRTITCDGQDEIINVQRARAIYSGEHCEDPGTIAKVASGAGVICQKEKTLLSCHGQKTCEVDSSILGEVVTCTGSSFSYTSNLFYIRYSCYKFGPSSTIHTSAANTVRTAQTVDILSPGFPCTLPRLQQAAEVKCTITPQRLNTGGSVRVIFEYKLIRFEESDCLDLFKVNKGIINKYDKCSSTNQGVYARNWGKTIQNVNGDVFLTVLHKVGSEGAIYWIRVSGKEDNSRIDLTVSCVSSLTDQVPHFQDTLPCVLEPIPTAPAPSTTETTTTTTTVVPSSGSVAPEPVAPISDTPLDSTAPDAVKHAPSKDEEKSPDLLYGVMGGLGSLILLAGLIIVLVLLLLRKRRGKSKDAEMAAENIYSEATSVPELETENTEDTYANVGETVENAKTSTKDEGDAKQRNVYSDLDKKEKDLNENSDGEKDRNSGLVYATIDKKKSRKELTQTDTDETIMCENDDLYDTSDLAKGNDESNDGNTEHEMVVEENPDLYEALGYNADTKNTTKSDGIYENTNQPGNDVTDAVTDDVTDDVINETNDYDDVMDENSERVRYEENELYSSSVDLTEEGDSVAGVEVEAGSDIYEQVAGK